MSDRDKYDKMAFDLLNLRQRREGYSVEEVAHFLRKHFGPLERDAVACAKGMDKNRHLSTPEGCALRRDEIEAAKAAARRILSLSQRGEGG